MSLAQHASILRSGSRYIIQDDKSEKGVFVNGKPIEKYVLQPSDTVTIGETVLRYQEKRRSLMPSLRHLCLKK